MEYFSSPALPTEATVLAALLRTSLTVSLAAMALLRPLRATAGASITDFALDYLNPAAQQQLGLPEQPGQSLLAVAPAAAEALAFLAAAFEAGEPTQRQLAGWPAETNGFANVAAQRQGEHLVLSFAPAARPLPVAPPSSAPAATRDDLLRVLENAPVAAALFLGTEHHIAYANQEMAHIWGRPLAQVLGKPVFAAMPEIATQGFEEIFGQVLAGQSYVLREMPVTIDRSATERPRQGYFDLVYRPQVSAQGQINGIVTLAVEVTEQVLARQQVEQLNQRLEARVQERTTQLAEQQRLLAQILGQMPAAVATFSGPAHHFSYVNEPYQAIVEGRAEVGRSLVEVLPEALEQGFVALLDEVYASGQPYYATDVEAVFFDPGATQPRQQFLDLIYQPLTDESGQVHGVLAFVTDVTTRVRERRQADATQADRLATAQRRAQERQELYAIFEQAPAAIVLLREPDHRIDYFNPAFTALFPPEGWVSSPQGHSLAEVFPRLRGAGLVARLDQVFTTGETQVVTELPLAQLQPGSARYVTFSYQAYREQDRIAGVAAFIYDVTEQVLARRQNEKLQAELLAAAQRRAQEREDLYQVFAQTPAAVLLLRGPAHRIEYANAAAEQLFPGREMQGRPIAESQPEAAAQGFVALLDRVYQTGETYLGTEVPLTVQPVPGQTARTTYLNFSYQAYREQGQVVGVSAFAYDVTEVLRARQQREQQQHLLETVFAQAPLAIFVVRGPRYHVELVNPLMQQILGHPLPALLGRPYFEAMPELTTGRYPALMQQVWDTGEAVVAHEVPAHLSYHQPGETGYFTFVYQPLRDEPHGPVTGIACVTIDVSAQVLARQQVQQLNQELETASQAMQATNEELSESNTRLTRANADLDTFVYAASHDLKSPITNIEGLLDALRQQLPAEALQAELIPTLLELLNGAVRRFQQTLDQLTDITRLQRIMLDQPIEAVDLPALAESVRLDILPELTAAAATLTVDLGSCPTVYFPAKILRSVLYNLLSNAVKYRAPDRPPLVQLRGQCTATGQVTLAVQDNGLGLSETQQRGLFQLFRRLHTHVPGSGVGLYTIKRMVENAGGTLTVESQPGVGSTFTVTLPAPPTPPGD